MAKPVKSPAAKLMKLEAREHGTKSPKKILAAERREHKKGRKK